MSTQRGHHQAPAFTTALIQTLNNEQNRDKGDWSDLSHGEILEGLLSEVSELTGEIAYSIPDWQRVSEEAVDVALFALFAWDKARQRIKEIQQVEETKKEERSAMTITNGQEQEILRLRSEIKQLLDNNHNLKPRVKQPVYRAEAELEQAAAEIEAVLGRVGWRERI